MLLGSLDRILHVERWHTVLLAENLCRWLDRLHIVNHLRNFSVNYAEEKFCIVQRDALLLAEHVEDGCFVTFEQPGEKVRNKRREEEERFHVRRLSFLLV